MDKLIEINHSIKTVEFALRELKYLIRDFAEENDLYRDEFYLLRWLRAGGMNVGKAANLMKNAVNWRKSNHIEELVRNERVPQDLLDTMPIYVDAMNNDGCVVATAQGGTVDFRALIEGRGKDEVVRIMTLIFAQAEKIVLDCNRRKCHGQPLTEDSVEGATLIVDFDHFSAKQLQSIKTIQAVIEICNILVKYFPGLGSTFICINCTGGTRTLLKILRSIIEGPYFKFEIFGADKEEWKDFILARIPASQIRHPFGGLRVDEGINKRLNIVERKDFQLDPL